MLRTKYLFSIFLKYRYEALRLILTNSNSFPLRERRISEMTYDIWSMTKSIFLKKMDSIIPLPFKLYSKST